ncbi:MAG: hypothetical protein HC812_07110 [Leptolyngbya sp. RL_3_1]|nr:hypothetical protein [Leptolyngbya sp. RL_3_1]
MVEVPLNAPLNQALLVAGGFNPRARAGRLNWCASTPMARLCESVLTLTLRRGWGLLTTRFCGIRTWWWWSDRGLLARETRLISC